MPLFDFKCENCETIEEHLVKRSDNRAFSFETPTKIVCSKCGSENVQRLFGASTFHFKGGGWAADLYGSTKAARKASKEE